SMIRGTVSYTAQETGQQLAKSNIRVLFFADTHLGFDYPIRPQVKRRRRGQDFFDNFQKVLADAVSSGVNLVIHGGDLFFRSRVPEKIVDLVYQSLLEFGKHGIPLLIVPGNHERSQLPPSLLLDHPGIFVFDRPRTFAFDLSGATVSVAGFPFVRHGIQKDIGAIVEQTGWRDRPADIQLLCMHQTVEGARVGPANYTFRKGPDIIRRADLPASFHAVLSGHIHRKQILTRPVSDNRGVMPIIYPGSTERTSFAEQEEKKGYFQLTFNQSAEDGWILRHLRFRELPCRPMADVEIDHNMTPANLEEHLLSSISALPADSIVRLRCAREIDPKIKRMLSASYLRRIFPPSMNVQLASEFYRPRKSPPPRPTRRRDHAPLISRIKDEVVQKPGIYQFRDRQGRVIYTGKTLNLRKRLMSYFQKKPRWYERRLDQMLFHVRDFSVQRTETELLALLLEDELIKKNRPLYNIKQKQFGEYQYLLLTEDRYPTCKRIDHSESLEGRRVFGPFKDNYLTDKILRLVHSTFHLRACLDPEPSRKSLNYELGLCRGPCRNKISPHAYSRIVQHVRAFLAGDETQMVEDLTVSMNKAAEKLAFEKAAQIRERIDFCRSFCNRQRFVHRFRTQNLLLREDSHRPRSYLFTRGRLAAHAPYFSAEQINEVILDGKNHPAEEDARFLLDRANIISRWIGDESRKCDHLFFPGKVEETRLRW
ncbi:metallophosphoesterase, partial [Candidatus Zixiibacteriota bacterium]